MKILCKINVKIFNLFVFIVPDSVLLYLRDNVLLYLALIRPAFCIGATVKPNWNKVCKKKMTTSNVETPTYACALISIFDSRIKPDNFKKVSCIF